MSLRLHDCETFGPALPQPFIDFQLEELLGRKWKLLPSDRGAEGRRMEEQWSWYRRKLRDLGSAAGSIRVANHVLEPLISVLGYASFQRESEVQTREALEDGGWLMHTADGQSRLRAWAVDFNMDLDAPNRRGRAYRFSPSRVAQRVLLAEGERVGLLTDGTELRILLCDPARPESFLRIRLEQSGGWRSSKDVPDSFRLLVALTSPAGVRRVPDLIEEARLAQSGVTKKLRLQARKAIEEFLQEVLDHPDNREKLASHEDCEVLARQLWREGLTLVYRLLFTLKLEASPDPARAFTFASEGLWRRTYSPNHALSEWVAPALQGHDTGGLLEGGLRALFRLFSEGLSSSGLKVSPLGGMLFGPGTTPLLDELRWGEQAVALLLRNLLWTQEGKKEEARRVYYGSLDVEDMGRVYEALLELEPGISTQPMCRLRRAKLEVVLPLAQGERYRSDLGTEPSEDEDSEEPDEEDDDSDSRKSGKTKVQWIEEIPPHRFYLRVGLGRKASGSYYTPHPFVRFLVLETLRPQIEQRSPKENPDPAAILQLKVLDPAMGSGHFLVEACRYLGEQLYEACQLCDGLASQLEAQAQEAPEQREELLANARAWRQRVLDLPDPNDELVAYLPSRAPEGMESGLSMSKALALCRRLVAVHCLYGVDKNPLAVELAKLALWLESYAEGLPLTFMDHRLVCGDSLTGPFFEHLLTMPHSRKPMDLVYQDLTLRLTATLNEALALVGELEATVGTDVADLELKRVTKNRLEAALKPFKLLAAAWTGGVMLAERSDDVGYQILAEAVAEGIDFAAVLASRPRLREMVGLGSEGVAYDLAFPEVFYPSEIERFSTEAPASLAFRTAPPLPDSGRRGVLHASPEATTSLPPRHGFDAVLGNPPWDTIRRADDQFFAAFDFQAVAGSTKREKGLIHKRLLQDDCTRSLYDDYVRGFENQDRISDALFESHRATVNGQLAGRGTYDAYMLFAERGSHCLRSKAVVGWILPSAFHANEGATGVRRLYLERMSLKVCFSFENRNKLFDIHRSFKFAAVVAVNSGRPTDHFHCAFYLHDLERLFDPKTALVYAKDFVQSTGGDYLTLMELRSERDRETAEPMFGGMSFSEAVQRVGMRLSQEVNMTYEAHRFTPTSSILSSDQDPRDPATAVRLREQGFLTLHEGKTFHQYDDRWGDRPRYVVAISAVADKPDWLEAAQHYRLAFRSIASSTNERTGIFGLLPPGELLGHSAVCEREPARVCGWSRQLVAAVANTFPFDWSLRVRASANISLFILNACPFPELSSEQDIFLSHSALRLTCNHEGYAPLWTEQVGEAWRESRGRYDWPVLQGDEDRWAVRAAIDAVVAQAYGLNREQYAHVLSTFSHRSYPKAPDLCLAMFDELSTLGLEAFTRKHDPYWDIPLNENLPKPVIDIPGLEDLDSASQSTSSSGRGSKGKKGTRGKLLFPAGNGPLFGGK